MATVQLSDIVDVTVFRDLPAVDGPEKTAFFESGVINTDPMLGEIANAAGRVAELPFWRDLDISGEPNYTTDDPTDIATPDNIEQGNQVAYKAFLNNGWSESDLASELVLGPKAMERIRARVDRYWRVQFQKRLLSACRGILADNIANDGSDMVHVAAGLTNADVTASTVFTRSNFTASAFTLGDMVDGISTIAVHSVVMKRMVDNGDIETIRDNEGNIIMQTYLGRRIVMDDSMPYTPAAGTGGSDAAPRYISMLFGPGAFGYGEGSPKVPVAVSREEEQGEGGGIETLWSRKTWLLHPFGFAQTPSTGPTVPAGNSFTLAELQNPLSWNRVIQRKNVPLAFLVTNG